MFTAYLIVAVHLQYSFARNCNSNNCLSERFTDAEATSSSSGMSPDERRSTIQAAQDMAATLKHAVKR